MDQRLNRKIFRKFNGFPDEGQNEGDAEHLAMSPEARIELAGRLLRDYVCGILNLPRIPPLNRSVYRIVQREEGDE